MTQRAYNFAAGPAALPESVLAQVQREMMALPGPKASILEISHRSPTFKEIIEAAEANIRKLLKISDDYAVLFLQGGGRLAVYDDSTESRHEGSSQHRLYSHGYLGQGRPQRSEERRAFARRLGRS